MKDNENNKESKDTISNDINVSGKNMDNNKSKKSKDLRETRGLNAEQNQTWDSRGYENAPASGQGNSRIKAIRRRNLQSEDSEGNFLSSLNISANHLLVLAGVVAGGTLLFRGIKGDWPFTKKISEIDLNTKQTIKRSREELYSYWRNLENLPNFMSQLDGVEEINDKISRWTAKIPGGLETLDWEAEITKEEKNEYLSWKSLPNSEIKNSGEVTFRDAPDGGTIVEIIISYHPPIGKAGDYTAKLLNPSFEKIMKRDLNQFKSYMEENRKSNSGKDLY